MTELHRHPYRVRFHDTDPAGIVFFANLFRIAHEAYESWLDACGIGLGTYVASGRPGMPIAHARADFKAPLRLAESLVIVVEARRVGATSFTLGYRFLDDAGTLRADLETVHVHLDSTTQRPTRLPPDLRARLGTS